jgi:cysteine-rich repeat protein
VGWQLLWLRILTPLDDGGACDVVDPFAVCAPGSYCGGGSCRVHICGDGVQAAGEACDDGNLDAGDGCTASCAIPGATIWDVVIDIDDQLEDDAGYEVVIDSGDGIPAAAMQARLIRLSQSTEANPALGRKRAGQRSRVQICSTRSLPNECTGCESTHANPSAA